MTECTEVTPSCPVEATIYGYYPNVGGNAFFVALFAVCTAAQLVLGIRYRLRAFTAVMVIGCGLEALGYGGRLLLGRNPWSEDGFRLQIVCLILAPSFMAAGIYLTLKHLVTHVGPENSRLRPVWYTRIFISCDAFSFLVQAAGGGIAASAADGSGMVATGNNLMIAGIAFQVVTMGICGLLAVDFAWRTYSGRRRRSGFRDGPGPRDRSAEPGWRFRFYLSASTVAFVTIFIRCIYRLPEMAGGWGNSLMRKEDEFLILDGMMIAIAAILMTVAYPGVFFPAISSRGRASSESIPRNKDTQPNDSDYSMRAVPLAD